MKKHLSSVIIVSLACIASGFGAYLLSSKISKMEEEAVALRQEIQGLEIKAARLSAQKQDGAAISSIDLLNRHFIGADGALGFVEYVESIAVSSGLAYKINLFDSEQWADGTKNDRELLKTSLTTTGSLKNTRNFISLIESLPYNIRINRVDLKKSVDSGTAGTNSGAKEMWTATVDFSAVKIMEKN